MENNQEQKIEIMTVQLLFKSKPQSPTAAELKDALEKYIGDIGENPYMEPSKESAGDMFMFPMSQYKVVMKDRPEGVPAGAVFISSNIDNGIVIDEMKRSQFWDVPNGYDLIKECKHSVLVHTMFGIALPYKEQAEILLAQVAAALDCFPGCVGIYAHQTGKLITPEMFEVDKEYSLSVRFIKLFVNARFFNLTGSDEMVVDTLGFNIFDGADIQVHFKNMDPNNIVSYVYNIASYQFDNNFVIESGETIDGIDEDGNMQMDIQWMTQYENSMIDPMRTVLDINCGKYAGGDR